MKKMNVAEVTHHGTEEAEGRGMLLNSPAQAAGPVAWLKGQVSDHPAALLAVCCLLPILAIILLQAAGVRGPMVFLAAIVACVGGHLLVGMWPGGKKCH